MNGTRPKERLVLEKYQSSLSFEVHDALFSYWRLPVVVQNEWIRSLAVDLRALDPWLRWHRVHQWMATHLNQSGTIFHDTQLLWPLALTLETHLHQVFVAAPVVAQDAGSPKAQVVAWLSKCLSLEEQHQCESLILDLWRSFEDDGEFYCSLLVLMTLLERVVGDCYHLLLRCGAKQGQPATNHEDQDDVACDATTTTPRDVVFGVSCQHDATTTHNGVGSGGGGGGGGGPRKNLILKDMVCSKEFASHLPDALVRCLQMLLLPNAMNVRNLIWHGFLSPPEVPKCWCSLVFVLLLDLAQVVTTLGIKFGRPWQPKQQLVDITTDFVEKDTPATRFDPTQLFVHHAIDLVFHPFCVDAFPTEPVASTDQDASIQQLCQVLTTISSKSGFLPQGRERLFEKAMRHLIPGPGPGPGPGPRPCKTVQPRPSELFGLLCLIPILEHALRLRFVQSNQQQPVPVSVQLQVAQMHQYYSTLDGFGQKTKHQVLLYPFVACSALEETHDEKVKTPRVLQTNQLYRDLPRAAVCVLLDLFMMASGPNIRAKLCHGEADLTQLFQRKTGKAEFRLSVGCQLLLMAWFSMCCHALTKSASSTSSLTTEEHKVFSCLQHRLQSFQALYTSSYHPLNLLRRSIWSTVKSLNELQVVQTRLEPTICLDIRSEWSSVVFHHGAHTGNTNDDANGASEKRLVVTDKTQRLVGFARQGDHSIATDANLCFQDQLGTQTNSLAQVLHQLDYQLTRIHHAFGHHFQASHVPDASVFIPWPNRLSSASETVSSNRLFDLLHAHDTSSQLNDVDVTCLALVVTDQSLSGTTCLLEILSTIQRCSRAMETRFSSCQQLIRAGKARSNHRKSFLNHVFVLPVLLKILSVGATLVEHQVLCWMQHAIQLLKQQDVDMTSVCDPRVVHACESLNLKLLNFLVAFETGCFGASNAASSNANLEKALGLAARFLDCKPFKKLLVALDAQHDEMNKGNTTM